MARTIRPNQSTRALLVGLLAIALALAGSTIALGISADGAAGLVLAR
jgi:hypothetical protein